MSHVATVQIQLKDLSLLEAVCRELKVEFIPGQQEVKLYSATATAVASFKLTNWKYPVAVQADGSVKYDNYGGRWGDQSHLNRVLQRYSERIAARHAQRMGMRVQRQERQDGSVVLRLQS